MNENLKIAYYYGSKKAVQDMEKLAFLDRAAKLVGNPFIRAGATNGAVAGAIGGFLNSEEGHGFRGALMGGLGGAALGGAAGLYGRKLLLGEGYEPVKNFLSYRGTLMNSGKSMAESTEMAMRNMPTFETSKILPSTLKHMAGTSSAGLLGGLGVAHLSGAND